jgi:hypothetical protein
VYGPTSGFCSQPRIAKLLLSIADFYDKDNRFAIFIMDGIISGRPMLFIWAKGVIMCLVQKLQSFTYLTLYHFLSFY